ncbi:MAG: S49 family peptidase [Phycisphaerales bacterium JB052]
MCSLSRPFLRVAAFFACGLFSLISAPASAQSVSLAVIELEGSPAEVEVGYSWLGDGTGSLLGIISTIDTLAYDNEFSGLVIRLKDSALGTTQVEEIGAAIRRLQAAGKKVHVFAEGYGTNDLLLASFADEAILQQGGYVSFPGLHAEEMYLADTLEWIGVEAQLVQVGDFKGANETMTRAQPSPEWNENIDGLLDGMYANIRDLMMQGRELTAEELDDAMRVIWAATGEEAILSGVIDAEVDLPDLRAHFEDEYGAEVNWVSDPYDTGESSSGVSVSPLAILRGVAGTTPQAVHIDHSTIAVLHINGTIINGDSTSGGLFGGGSSVGSRTIRNAIESILQEDLIKGVIVRVDSPGGSAIASEVMWQGIDRLKTEKPVWVSVGSMAASGGYYVLSAGDKVFVNPSSVVGSIGVVGGKYARGELYSKAKINIVERSRGPMGDLFSSTKPWDTDQIAMMRGEMRETYELFTSRVEAGREGIDLDKTAEGRLFVGSDAIELNMADEIGGLDDAINGLAAEVGIADFDVVHYPQPPSFEEVLMEQFGQFLRSPQVAVSFNPFEKMMRSLLGESRYNAIVDSLNAISLLQDEKVLLVNPRVIYFR